MAIMTEQQARDLLTRVLSFSRADECQCQLTGSNEGNIRYARNSVSTSGEVSNVTLAVSSSFGKQTGAATIVITATAAATPALAEDTIKIGVITTLSGPAGYLGQDVRDGLQLAIDMEGGKLGGVPVELVVEDDGLKPGNGRQIAAALAMGAAGVWTGSLWLTVEDDGPGIDEGQWDRLLQRGARGDERVEGHGLGLAIVTELVSAYGGTVSIAHSELGGARIRVEFPAN